MWQAPGTVRFQTMSRAVGWRLETSTRASLPSVAIRETRPGRRQFRRSGCGWLLGGVLLGGLLLGDRGPVVTIVGGPCDFVGRGASLMAAEAPPRIGRKVAEFSAKDYRGKTWSLSEFADRPLIVIAVLGTECPLAKLYATRLQHLAEEYGPRGVAVIGIAPNVQDSLTELGAFARQQKLEFPLVKDLQQRLANQLGAERTPEVFVLDRERVVRYAGRVDDQHAIGGKSRPEPTQHELRAALDELLAGRVVSVPTTVAMGCLIGRDPGSRSPTGVVAAGTVGADVEKTGAGTGNSANRVPTFSKDVAPILNAHCVECHRPGEIGPFSLSDYEDVAGWAAMIAEVTKSGQMPPWHADPKFGTFLNANRLTAAEIATLEAWSKAGAPQGDPRDLPSPPRFTEGWQLPRMPDAVIPMAAQPFKVKATGEVRYQYFKADPQFTEDRWVTAAEVRPGNRAVVHHVIVFTSTDGKLVDNDRNMLCAYVPGLQVDPYPAGMAKRIPAGAQLIFQVHYTPNGSPQEDLSVVGLTFADPATIVHEVQTISAARRNLKIEPYKAHQKFSTNPVTAPADLLLLGFMPHMHLRGQSFRYEMLWPNGNTETLLNVPQFDFNWQTGYRLAEPMVVPKGSQLTAHASFDNSAGNLGNPDPSATVTWGDQSWEEMLIGYCEVAIPRGSSSGSPRNLGQEVRRQVVTREVVNQLFKSLDKNQDGKIERHEVGDRLQTQFSRADIDGDGIVTLRELEERLPELRREAR